MNIFLLNYADLKIIFTGHSGTLARLIHCECFWFYFICWKSKDPRSIWSGNTGSWTFLTCTWWNWTFCCGWGSCCWTCCCWPIIPTAMDVMAAVDAAGAAFTAAFLAPPLALAPPAPSPFFLHLFSCLRLLFLHLLGLISSTPFTWYFVFRHQSVKEYFRNN